jgi:hypothetical protein
LCNICLNAADCPNATICTIAFNTKDVEGIQILELLEQNFEKERIPVLRSFPQVVVFPQMPSFAKMVVYNNGCLRKQLLFVHILCVCAKVRKFLSDFQNLNSLNPHKLKSFCML